MIETIHDVGECTSIEELQNQIDNYNQVIAEYKRENPICAAIVLKMHTDENFAHFMGLLSTVGTLGARIKELEEKTND